MSKVIILKRVLLSYPDLHQRGRPPKDKPNEPGKFGGQFIFDIGSDAETVSRNALIAEAQETFGPNWKNILSEMEKSKKFLRKGDGNLDNSGNIRNGYAGKMYVKASNKIKPLLIGPRRTHPPKTELKNDKGEVVVSDGFPVLTADSGKPYGGCIVNAKIEVRGMKAKGDLPNQVYANLLTVQFVEDGTPFGSAQGTAEGFEEEGEPETAEGGNGGNSNDNDDLGL